ncbi:MAG TPA: hypothetical protein DHW45_00180 [Candidatus Latescibacteria bacterium]|nr:hypothetical protein [Candidatus Latescibacterota bacterium]
MSRIVTLTTDFGYQDSYVGQMKGVLLGLNPSLTIVDITHAIEPQDVRQGAYVVSTSFEQFPAGTIHVGVVDPGVGTDRRPIIVVHDDGLFVGPDNGLFTAILKTARSVVEISRPSLIKDSASCTFHGRDLFSPTAAFLSLGEPAASFGDEVSDPIALDEWTTEMTGSGIRGPVLHVDRFGNAITSIRRVDLGGDVTEVVCGEFRVPCLSNTYGEVDEGEAIALIGSQDTLELSVSGGSVASSFGIKRGAEVEVSWRLGRSGVR